MEQQVPHFKNSKNSILSLYEGDVWAFDIFTELLPL